MAKTVLEVAMDKIDEDIQTRVNQLRAGALLDFSEYKNVCGQIRGLEYAHEHLKSLLRNQIEADNE